MAVKGHRVDLLHLLLVSQPGQAEAVLPAHGPQQAAHGVNLLVVELAFDGGDQVAFLALHKFHPEAPILQGGFLQQLPEKPGHGLQHPVPGQGETLVHEAAVQPRGLVVPHPAHQWAHRRAVQVVQGHGDAAQVRVAHRSPEQHRGDQGIHGRLGLRHRPHQLHAEAALLKPGIPAAAQNHTGKKGMGFNHIISS